MLEASDDQSNAKTSNAEDMELALQMISLFMKHYPKSLGGYLHEIFNLLSLIHLKVRNQDVRISSYSLMPNLIKVAKETPQVDPKTLSKQVFAQLWEKFIEERESSHKAEYCFFL